mgnify:CR=1 FL=1
MERAYQLSRDPAYFLMAVFFALLTTGLPAVMGQPRFLPLNQAVVLTIFVAIALRRGDIRSGLAIVYLWLGVSMALLMVLTWFVPEQMERAIDNGFMQRAMTSEWYFARSPLPAGITEEPLAGIVEIAGILLGSLLTGGLVGAWFLMGMANLAAFSAGHLLAIFGNPLLIFIALPIWSILEIIGAGGLVVVFAEPLLSGRFALGSWFQRRKRLLALFGVIFGLGLLAEALLPAFWHFHS